MSSSWTDYSQNRRIRELEEGLDSAHARMASERSRMRSELSHIRGTLEQRLNRVSASLDAFIELSDIRVTLAMFDDSALARHRTLQMLDGVPLSHLELEDVPGYWLVPAARGLHALLSDDVGTARLRFDEAARRDAPRTRHFAALATALTRAEHARAMGENATTELLPHLPVPTEQVTRGQRALWLLTADGSFGDDAREQLLLATIRHWSHQQVSVPTVTGLSTVSPLKGSSSRRGRIRASLKDSEGISQRATAALQISELRENVARITALSGEETPLQALAPDEASAEFLTQTLRMLVEEGSAEEAPLLARASTLRAIIEDNRQDISLPQWTDPVGTVTELLGDDLSREGAPPHRRTFALVLQRSAVMDRAEELVRQASVPVEDSTTATVQGVRVEITSNGAEPGNLERARQQLYQRVTHEGSARVYLWGCLAMTVLLVVLGLASGNGFVWFLCLTAAVGAGVAFAVDQKGRKETQAMVEARGRQLDGGIADAAEQWRDTLLGSEQHAATARHDAEEIRRLLNP